MVAITGFVICSIVIFFAGRKLLYYGEILSEISGMGKAWIGLVLMATVTSLPELIVGIGSSAILQSADLATGDIIGSCAINLGILSLMDVFTPRDKPLLGSVSSNHILSAALGIILISMVGLGIFLNEDIVLTPSIGLTSILFAVIYFLSVKIIHRYQCSTKPEKPAIMCEVREIPQPRTVVLRYMGFAVVIVLTALALPYFVQEIAQETGIGNSFAGTLLLACSTSLPEIAISLTAIKVGSTDLAVGNLLGSNIFNVFILFVDDLFYFKGHLLKDASDVNLLSVFFVLLMSATVIIGFTFPSKKKKVILAWDTMVIFVLYVFNIILLYKLS